MRKIIFALAFAAITFGTSAFAGEGGFISEASTKPTNVGSLQRGARIYFSYCAACHSIKQMNFQRIARDLQLSDEEALKNFAFSFPDAKIGDPIVSIMPPSQTAAWLGKEPPDLSLEGRSKGGDWIFSYLKAFYLDPSRPTGWNNAVFPNASMPNVLWDLQGVQHAAFKPAKPGEDPAVEKLEAPVDGKLSAEEFDQTARDVTAFLEYVGEPALLQRHAVGAWVILYLVGFTFLAWLLKKEFWKDVH